jgi:hypothetical protein
MAMRQAGAEAAKKAGERKATKSIARPSAKEMEATDMPMPAIETKMAKSVEEPGASAETIAAKVPEKLAEEGAKRTSVDKIAEEGAKRTSTDKAAESEGAGELEHVGPSKEATILEARRASSITKLKSPLSEESTAPSNAVPRATSSEQKPRTHRGSSVSLASKEEIQEIEKRNAILEEAEESDDSTTTAETRSAEANPADRPEKSEALKTSAEATTTDVASSNEAEVAATKGVKPQDEDAKEAEAAGTSVGD